MHAACVRHVRAESVLVAPPDFGAFVFRRVPVSCWVAHRVHLLSRLGACLSSHHVLLSNHAPGGCPGALQSWVWGGVRGDVHGNGGWEPEGDAERVMHARWCPYEGSPDRAGVCCEDQRTQHAEQTRALFQTRTARGLPDTRKSTVGSSLLGRGQGHAASAR